MAQSITDPAVRTGHQEVTLKFRTEGGTWMSDGELCDVTGFYVEYTDNDMSVSTTLNYEQAIAFGLTFNIIAEILEDAMLDDAKLAAMAEGRDVGHDDVHDSRWRGLFDGLDPDVFDHMRGRDLTWDDEGPDDFPE
ncbi:hypothetical protein [Bifidobacterium choloepi]|uniref:Uncharacterized protein n=1 Tax=Bifidobacterium choloepi TaxID=2614131 RepID=A0A6I5MZC6_9BIFI|nr:hypothetical protein [Bifidobacterium choloepi]NEG69566.1 hypothetical protein [Bifidobacterium choloepi]